MSDVFGGEGGGKNQGGAKKKAPKGEQPKPNPTQEGERGKYMQYDNEMGAMMVDLPPQFQKYKGELEEDLMDAFYGEQAGGKQMHQTIDEWIADWMKKKIEEDPSLAKNPDDDAF
jgi:hypothetical protein